MVVGSSLVTVTKHSDITPVLSKTLLDIRAATYIHSKHMWHDNTQAPFSFTNFV